MNRERAVVICPGRGSYSAQELGYLARHHEQRAARIADLDEQREPRGAAAVASLDALSRFSPAKHLPGRNASNLIYTSAVMDFAAIDQERFDIVAVCGNSLGWYLSLACAGTLSLEDGALLVDTMGDLMEREGVGGQLLLSVAHDDWTIDHERRGMVLSLLEKIDGAYLSIDLGATLVLAGDDAALARLKRDLEAAGGDAPVRLPKHAAFHTPLLSDIAETARGLLAADLFGAPATPLIDGRGGVHSPYAADVDALYSYTLGAQITRTYDFAKSVEVAIKEFAPDRLILLGPGYSLGAPIAQVLIAHRWHGMTSRDDFMAQQKRDPFLLAMGRDDQRAMTTL
ncbi:MAG: ACP S-malonyltransferase [Pacificimonas sp.]|jgi:acyl transferase domain-containing protein|nr:ACP S-malonyltransferase [Pacificimonas sp.]